MEDELAGWIEDRTAELIRNGCPAGEARERARREFGDFEAARAYCIEQDLHAHRTLRMRRYLDELLQDARSALRGMARSPLLAAVLLLTLALGIGATSAIYTVAHAVLLRPLPYRGEEDIVQLHGTDQGARAPMGQVSSMLFTRLVEHARAFSAVAAVASAGTILQGDNGPERVAGARVSVSLQQVLGVNPALGTWFAPGADSAGAEPVAILTDSLWRSRFGADPSVIGKSVMMGTTSRRIVGVMQRGFLVPLMSGAQVIVPLDLAPVLRDQARAHRFRFLQVVARARPGTDRAARTADAMQVMHGLTRELPDAYQGLGLEAVPLRDEMTGVVRAPLLALLGAAVLLLLITCANVASVLLARAVARQGEFAVRTALGAGRGRIVRLMATDAMVLSILGGAAGLAVAWVGVQLLQIIGGDALPPGFGFHLGAPSLIVAALTSLLCGLVFGTAPSLMAGRLAASGAAMGGARGTDAPTRMRLRKILLASQVALSLSLLVGSGLLARSLRQLLALDLGYRTDHVATFRVSLPGQRYDTPAKEDAFWATLTERVDALPGVTGVGYTGSHPLLGSSGASLVIDGRPFAGDRPPEVRYGSVSDDYFKAMGIPVIEGRGFQAGDEQDGVRAVVVSAAAARTFWQGDSPIGARIRLGPDATAPKHTVVGVVQDVRLGAADPVQPHVFSSMRYDRWGGGDVVLSYAGAPPSLAALRSILRDIDPLMPLERVVTIEDLRTQLLAGRRLPFQLVSAFGVLAALLVAIGLYGVGVNQVVARRRELGVRMALGASRRGIVGMVLGDSLRTVGLGVLIGVPMAMVLARQLNALLYEVRPSDPLVLSVVSGGLLAVGLLAAMVPARRAVQVDPAQVLRGE